MPQRRQIMRNEYPVVRADELGWLTESQMIEVDRVMIHDLRIELVQMMENAGRNLAQLVLDLYDPDTVTVLSGSGGNGATRTEEKPASASHAATRSGSKPGQTWPISSA